MIYKDTALAHMIRSMERVPIVYARVTAAIIIIALSLSIALFIMSHRQLQLAKEVNEKNNNLSEEVYNLRMEVGRLREEIRNKESADRQGSLLPEN